jgi:hypothetical protein
MSFRGLLKRKIKFRFFFQKFNNLLLKFKLLFEIFTSTSRFAIHVHIFKWRKSKMWNQNFFFNSFNKIFAFLVIAWQMCSKIGIDHFTGTGLFESNNQSYFAPPHMTFFGQSIFEIYQANRLTGPSTVIYIACFYYWMINAIFWLYHLLQHVKLVMII